MAAAPPKPPAGGKPETPPPAAPPKGGKAPEDKDKDTEAEEDEDDEESQAAADAASNTATSLDELSHAECRALYDESTRNVLFAKRQQWRVLEHVTALTLALVAICALSPLAARFSGFMAVFTLAISIIGMVLLVLFQYWQNREQAKLWRIAAAFSSFSQKTRELKGRIAADVHRYTILFFMEIYLLIFSVVMFKVLLDLGVKS